MKLQLEQLFGNGGIDAISAMARQMAFDALFEKLPISFYWMDKNGILLGCNDNVLTALGLQSTDQLIGKHSNELVTEEAWLNSKHVIETEKPVVFEEESYSQNDSKNITYLSIKSPIFNDDGSEVIGLLGFSIYNTDRKNMEK